MELLPCRFCGQTPWVEYGTDVSYGIRMEHLCRTTPCETEADAAAEWNAANALADPALLALAKLASRLIRRGLEPGFGLGALLTADAVGCAVFVPDATDSDYSGPVVAPGIADAIARLLAPDGAASEGVTG